MNGLSRRTLAAAGGLVAVLAAVAIVLASGLVDVGDLATAAGNPNTRRTPCDPPRPPTVRLTTTASPAKTTPCPSPVAAPTATATATATVTATATATAPASPTATPTPIPAVGTVWAWGGNSENQLGYGAYKPNFDNTYYQQLIPVQVGGQNSGFIAISAPNGGEYSMGLKSDGTVWTWGATPSQAAGLSGITAIAAGRDGGFALKNDGTVWDVGGAVQLNGLSSITAIAAGDGSLMRALKSDGTVWNKDGSQISGISSVTAIAVGAEHTLALKSDGTVWAWGANDFGQCGVDPVQTTAVAQPTQVPGLASITAIAAGSRQSMALKSDGTVWMWGQNFALQLGRGLSDQDPSFKTLDFKPGQVVGQGANGVLTGIVAISSGRLHSLALAADGTVYAWGKMQIGGLGDGTTDGSPSPIKVKLPTPAANAKVIAIGGARNHSMALYGPK